MPRVPRVPRVPRLPAAVARALANQRLALGLAPDGDDFGAVTVDAAAFADQVGRVAARLGRDGFVDAAVGAALAVVAAAMRRTRGLSPYPTQLYAAWLLCRGYLVEMATGEGKTVAAALAAAIGGLAGRPVHVLTANDYLVGRDEAELAPFYACLGLTSATVKATDPRPARAAAYRHSVVHVTARELVFDYLNDHVRLGGERDPNVLLARSLAAESTAPAPAVADNGPVLPALAFAVVDEADSILLDEACMPLILSQPGVGYDGVALQRLLAIAGQLASGSDFVIDSEARTVRLADPGRRQVAREVADATGLLRPARRAFELVEAALVALHLFQRDRDYAVVDGKLVLIDEITGRVATGRRWSGALHPFVELKEGLEPEAPAVTAARMTYQRFFERYEHLCGMSGTLAEDRRELAATYGLGVRPVPLARPDRRRWLGERMFTTDAERARAVVDRVRHCLGRGRPVLIGTESVAASHRLSARLKAAGIEHSTLNAVQTDDEAQLIAAAGRSGIVTVATNIAGRGTDIRLEPGARAAGGLHVIATMRNRSRRIDRQLVGRGARHGDPGSAECLLSLDDGLIRAAIAPRWRTVVARRARDGRVPRLLARWLAGFAQWRFDRLDRQRRARLRAAEARQAEQFGWFGGAE